MRSGGLVVYPTDTVYGLGCDPFNEAALKKLIRVKERSGGNLPVLVSTRKRAGELGSLSHIMSRLVDQFWPGSLTVVVPCGVNLSVEIIGTEKMIGLRLPNRSDTLDLITESGGAIIGTSANISGQPSIVEGREAYRVFDGKVDIILNAGRLVGTRESTVVKETETGIQVLREGALARDRIKTALGTDTMPLT